MKQTLLYILVPAVVLATITAACDGKFEPDPIDPRVPRYSEEPLNAAGALINGEVWRAVLLGGFIAAPSDQLLIEQDSDGIRLIIEGQSSDSSSMLAFYINDPTGNFKNLSRLNGQKFVLDGTHKAVIGNSFFSLEDTLCSSSSGQLYIRSVKSIPQDDENDYHLSGTFSFVIDQDACRRVEVTDGRFDYRVR